MGSPGEMSIEVRHIDVEQVPAPPSEDIADLLKVLVVDDSKLQRKILCSSVKRWGFEVFEAASGEEALQIAAEIQPDLVLSDWMMPGMNGLEFCNAFRRLSGDRYGYFLDLSKEIINLLQSPHGIPRGLTGQPYCPVVFIFLVN